MIKSTKEIFKNCYGRYGIAAVNVWCMEQVHGLFSAAQKANAPFIVQTTAQFPFSGCNDSFFWRFAWTGPSFNRIFHTNKSGNRTLAQRMNTKILINNKQFESNFQNVKTTN